MMLRTEIPAHMIDSTEEGQMIRDAKLRKAGFDLKKRYTRYADWKKCVIVYEQQTDEDLRVEKEDRGKAR